MQAYIAGDLGGASGNVNVTTSGSVRVGGDLVGNFANTGDAGTLTVDGDVYGDISGTDVTATIGGSSYGDISTLSCSTITIGGDLRGSLGVRTLSSNNSIYIAGDVVDTGDNHVWIESMTNATFECNNMELMQETIPGGQFCIGFCGTSNTDRWTSVKSGTVTINGVLSGRIRAYGCVSLHFIIGGINGALDPYDSQYGGIDIAGYVSDDCVIDVLGNMTQGRIAYGSNVSDIYRGSMGGTISIAGDVGQNCIIGTQHQGLAASPIYPCDVAADITIGGHCAGDILSTRHFTSAASITINGDVASTARIETIGAYQSTVGSIDSPIHVDGDCDGEITALDDLGADVRIDGQFQQNAAIDIDGAKDAGVMVLINDDGGAYLADRLWHDDATVSIGATTYENDSASVNTTTSDVWYIDAIKGDMDHDFALTGFDIDPFVLALTNETSYEATYPYLASSRVFRGDCNCDDLLNSFDIDPFVAWLVNGDPTEDLCPAPQLQMMMLSASLASEEENAGHANDPQTLAGILYASVTPTNLTAFEASLTADIAGLPAGAERTYWEAVLAELALLTE